MLNVSASAKKKLQQSLKHENTEDNTFIRIVSSAGIPSKIEFILDRERQEDRIIHDEKGNKLLLLDRKMENILSDMILDYKTTGDKGMQFTIKGKDQ